MKYLSVFLNWLFHGDFPFPFFQRWSKLQSWSKLPLFNVIGAVGFVTPLAAVGAALLQGHSHYIIDERRFWIYGLVIYSASVSLILAKLVVAWKCPHRIKQHLRFDLYLTWLDSAIKTLTSVSDAETRLDQLVIGDAALGSDEAENAVIVERLSEAIARRRAVRLKDDYAALLRGLGDGWGRAEFRHPLSRCITFSMYVVSGAATLFTALVIVPDAMMYSLLGRGFI